MARKRNNRPPLIVAGRLRRAYSGEKLLRLQKAIQVKIHKRMEELRDDYRAAADEVTAATTRKIGLRGWKPIDLLDAREIGVLRAELSHDERLRVFFLTYLDFFKTYKGAIRFNAKRVKASNEAVEELTYQMNRLAERLVRLSRKRRKERDVLKRSFRLLFQRISRQKEAQGKLNGLKKRLDEEQRKADVLKMQSIHEIESFQELLSERKIPFYKGFLTLKQGIFRKLNAQRAVAAEAEENMWIFLHGFARTFLEKDASPLLFEELARRRHNATEEKNRCLKRAAAA